MLSEAFTLAADHAALPGHFPGQPIVPGVVILQQVLALAAGQGWRCTGLPQVKFLQPLLPGECCRIELREDGRPGRWRFECSRDGIPIAQGQLLLEGRAE